MTKEYKDYTLRKNGRRMKSRTIKIVIDEEDVHQLMEKLGLTKKEAEARVLDIFINHGHECVGTDLVKCNVTDEYELCEEPSDEYYDTQNAYSIKSIRCAR